MQEMVAAGQIEQVRAYCLSDVAQTAALFLRTQLLRGELAPGAYIAAMEALIAAIERERRLAPLLSRIDHKRLLTVEVTGADRRARIFRTAVTAKPSQ
ncbi:hypothetical protein [Sorangium sp. So ce117]|uniref:hypothetical protein n=1 Tax=Sorangium sp. So ce117 TaxID=3133277 RepID=UPI003F636A32